MSPTTSDKRDALSRRQVLAAAAFGPAIVSAHLAYAQGSGKFRFMTPFGYSLAFAPVLYARAGGFLAKEGLDAEIIAGKGAALAAQMTIAGQAEAARTGAGNYMVARINNGAPLIAIATIAQVSPFYVLSPKAKPLAAPSSFPAKKIGMASLGGSMEETLNLTLRRAGVDAATVEKVKIADTPASYALVEAGRVDGIMGNISTAMKAQAAFKDVAATRMDDGVPGQVYVATPETLARNEAAYVAFLRGVHRAASAIIDARDDAKALDAIIAAMGKTFDLGTLDDPALARRDLTENAASWTAKGRDNLLRNVPELWAVAVELMAEAGMLKTAPDAATLYTNAVLDKALR